MKTMQSLKTKLTKSPWILLVAFLGVAFIIVGLIFYLFLMHSLINKIIAQKVAIAEGSETYEKWRDIPMPIYYRYYFFNVSNAAEIERIGSRPLVKEIGPFTYRSKWVKNPVIFHHNGTVSYKERKTLHFVPELSVASDSEKILVTINGPLTVTLALLQKAPLFVRNIVSLGLNTVSEGFFIKRSARELLFDGYAEVLTSFGPLLNPSIPNTKGRFAWMYNRNNSDDGMFTVHTGQDDFSKINQIDQFKGHNQLQYWKPNSHCNQLHTATDGQIIAPSNDNSFELFHPDMCRKIKLNADKNFNVTQFNLERQQQQEQQRSAGNESDESSAATAHPEIKFEVNRYVPDTNTLTSVDSYPANACYLSKITPSRPELGDLIVTMRQSNSNFSKFLIRPFSHTKDGRIYFKSGVFDMSVCKYGAPVLLSYPHFLDAHASYRQNIHGLNPDRKKHQFYMLVEPKTGSSILSKARIQINVYITKPPWISRFRYVPEVVFPVFWQELSAEMPADLVEHINWALTTPFQLADFFSIGLIVIGLCLIVRSIFMVARKGKHSLTPINSIKNNKDHFGPTDNFGMNPMNGMKGIVNNGLVLDEGPNRNAVSYIHSNARHNHNNNQQQQQQHQQPHQQPHHNHLPVVNASAPPHSPMNKH